MGGQVVYDPEWLGGMLLVAAKFQGLTRGAEEIEGEVRPRGCGALTNLRLFSLSTKFELQRS